MDTKKDTKIYSRLLLDWYYAERRILPWREDPTPYHVWISEIMLQQTRVEAVKEYYRRFLEALPDVRALAEAEEAEYMKLWEGLGYYSRVRNMHKAAVVIMEEHGGQIPGTSQELEKLPGIGSYTAAAIATIAFGINSGAYVAEILRGGIMSIDKGQFEAGRSIGFNYVQTMFYVIIPQVFKNVLPALLNEFIALLKETSIAGYVGVMDLTRAANSIRGATFSAFMPLIALALIYLVFVLLMTKLVGLVERRLRKSER